jgi:hypothetical protein
MGTDQVRYRPARSPAGSGRIDRYITGATGPHSRRARSRTTSEQAIRCCGLVCKSREGPRETAGVSGQRLPAMRTEYPCGVNHRALQQKRRRRRRRLVSPELPINRELRLVRGLQNEESASPDLMGDFATAEETRRRTWDWFLDQEPSARGPKALERYPIMEQQLTERRVLARVRREEIAVARDEEELRALTRANRRKDETEPNRNRRRAWRERIGVATRIVVLLLLCATLYSVGRRIDQEPHTDTVESPQAIVRNVLAIFRDFDATAPPHLIEARATYRHWQNSALGGSRSKPRCARSIARRHARDKCPGSNYGLIRVSSR